MNDQLHNKDIIMQGRTLDHAGKVLLMLHGRGGSAEDILTLSQHLQCENYALLALQARNNTWYPYSFLAPTQMNQPWLNSAIDVIDETVNDLSKMGFDRSKIVLLGFSQGACLALEYAARNAHRYGGVIAFTGGLIGDNIQSETYNGSFDQTPVFIGTSDPDPHVPIERIHETVDQLNKMNADVNLKVYKNMGHTITMEEILQANKLLQSVK